MKKLIIIGLVILISSQSTFANNNLRHQFSGMGDVSIGVNEDGFNLSTSIHEDTGTLYDPEGFDINGLDVDGYGERDCLPYEYGVNYVNRYSKYLSGGRPYQRGVFLY